MLDLKDDKTPIREIFGDSPKVKVLDVLIGNPNLDYSKKELAEAAEISKNTLYKLWDELVEKKMVKKTRKIGNATLYKLNEDSKIVKELVEFEKRLLQSEEIRQR